MQDQNQEQDNWQVTTGESIGLLYLAVSIHAAAITPLMRHTFGSRAFDPQVIFALIALLSLAGSYPAFQPYLLAWFVAVVIHRIQSLTRKLRVHTRYPGYPWLAMRLPFMNTEEKAREAEPIICLVGGAMLAGLSPSVGLFVMGGFVSLAALMALDKLIIRRRLQSMNDAAIEMEFYSERFRGGR